MQSIPWLKGKFHIPDALLRKYQYLDLYPLDGGAGFIVDEFVKTRNDKEVTEKLLSGELLKKWGTPGNMDWSKNGETRNLELYMWIQRWYCLASVARTYYVEKDEKLAELTLQMMADWGKKIGYPRTREEVYALQDKALDFDYKFQRGLLESLDVHVPWEWYDFQPAYRLLVLVVSAHLLRDSKAMQKHSKEMLEWIAYHANSILWITEKYGFIYGNHHTLRMMCLFLAGEYVEHPDSAKWRKMALDMQTRHIAEDFFEDGMYKESLPGYTPFVVTHFREVLLSTAANKEKIPEIFERNVRKSLKLLKAMVMPDGFLPVINDGPRVNITGVLELMEHYYPAASEGEVKPFSANTASAFPIFHDKRNYLIFDANYALGTHVQAGKLGFILWRDDEAFIIEGGCSNYDNPDFQPFFRRGWAHSTLLVDGQEDAVWKAFWVWEERAHPVIKEFGEGKKPFVRAESDGFKRLGVMFSRQIDHPSANQFTITDEIRNEPKTERKFTFRFMLAQEDVKTDEAKNTVTIKGPKNTLKLTASTTSEIAVTRVKTNFFGDMREVPCVDFTVKSAEDFKQVFTLRFS